MLATIHPCGCGCTKVNVAGIGLGLSNEAAINLPEAEELCRRWNAFENLPTDQRLISLDSDAVCRVVQGRDGKGNITTYHYILIMQPPTFDENGVLIAPGWSGSFTLNSVSRAEFIRALGGAA